MEPIHLTLTIQSTGQRFSPHESTITIGNQSGNTIMLPDDQAISRHHATINWQDGQYILQDNNSSNGTFVNEQRLSQPHVLKHNDVLRIGQTQLNVELPPANAEGLNAATMNPPEEQPPRPYAQIPSLDDVAFSGHRPLSRQLKRSFSRAILSDDGAIEQSTLVQQALKEVKEMMPSVRNAYQSSNKVSRWGCLAMMLAWPFILGLTILCSGITLATPFLLWQWLDPGLVMSSVIGEADIRGYLFFLALLGIIFLAAIIVSVVIPQWIYAYLSRGVKNRNGCLTGILVGLIIISNTLCFYWLIFSENSTGAIFGLIPLHYPFLFVGLLLAPFYGMFSALFTTDSDKFCEITQRFLKPMYSNPLELDWAEDVIRIVQAQKYSLLKQIEKEPVKARKTEVVLWWHDQAETAYLEVKLTFSARVLKKDKKEDEVKETWLVWSQKMNRAEAEEFLRQVR